MQIIETQDHQVIVGFILGFIGALCLVGALFYMLRHTYDEGLFNLDKYRNGEKP